MEWNVHIHLIIVHAQKPQLTLNINETNGTPPDEGRTQNVKDFLNFSKRENAENGLQNEIGKHSERSLH